MRHTQSFLYEKSIKEWFCFPVNFVKFLKTPFLQNTSGWLFLLRLKCKLKLWLQSKRIYTPLLWPLRRLSYKPPHLKQHHCSNRREFKILQQMSSQYLLSTSAYKKWLLICETGNKWHICKSVYMELSGGEMNYFETLDWLIKICTMFGAHFWSLENLSAAQLYCCYKWSRGHHFPARGLDSRDKWKPYFVQYGLCLLYFPGLCH